MKIDGDGEEYLYERAIPKIDLGYKLPEDSGLRCFDGFDYQGTPEDDWGMEMKSVSAWPAWIQDVHNHPDYVGKRAFVFGSGPSLIKELPLLHHMKSEYTLTVNRIKQWKEIPFDSTWHCIAEPGPCDDWGKKIWPIFQNNTATNRIAINWWPVTAPGWLWCPKAPDDIQGRWEGTQGLGDTLAPLPTFWASPMTSSQLLLWMGFSEIYFLGMDTTQVGQAWDVQRGRTAYARNIRSILESADRLTRDIQRAGRKVFDCSQGGRLNQEGAMPFMKLEDVLEAVAV